MFDRKNFDADAMFEKFMDMSGEECKAMLFGVLMGIGLSDMMDEKDNEETPRRTSYSSWGNFDKIRLEFCKKEDAWDVLDEMRDKIKEEGIASVKDLFLKSDMPTTPNMKDWGWRDLEAADVTDIGCRVILNMPPADYIVDYHMPDAFKRITFLYNDIDEAGEALNALKEGIVNSRYNFITVQDAISITGQDFYIRPKNKATSCFYGYMRAKDKAASSFYGWDDLDNVFVALDHRYRGEGERWIINMPPAKPIDPCPQPEHVS